MESIIRVDNLTHTYGVGTPFQRSAVEGLSLDIRRGEFLGIIGHTGSGKSTLIQHLNGLLKPSSGTIYLDGADIWAEPKKIRSVRFRVGLVFQYPEYQLFEDTVRKDVAFGPKNMGLDAREVERRVLAALSAVGLDESVLDKSPFALSGGQKRRVAIAGVMAMEPEVLILDEPTAGLDPRGRESILQMLREYHEKRGSTVVLVSHSMEEIARNAQRIIVLSGGGVCMEGTPAEVFARADELEAVGLDVPQSTKIAAALRRRGMKVEGSIFTVDALERAILPKKEVGSC